MCSNVLPSAPHEESSLYPHLSQHDFRMQKANEISAALNTEKTALCIKYFALYACVNKLEFACKIINQLSEALPPEVLTCQSSFDKRKKKSRASSCKLIFVSSLLSRLPKNFTILECRLGVNFFMLWLIIPFLPRPIVVILNYCKCLNRF